MEVEFETRRILGFSGRVGVSGCSAFESAETVACRRRCLEAQFRRPWPLRFGGCKPQEALGHQTITMTMRYSHLAPDHLRAAVAALDGMLPVQQPEPAKTSAQDSAQEGLVETIKGSR